ncbi:MAG: outer membrane beta-barrel protein [Elusimicrobiaceae bacterium]|nr:outer membrane beta-barrel protein [Elusimicrobiaceae bacterium]
MRKLMCLLVLLTGLCPALQASGVEEGDFMYNFYAGLGSGLQRSGVEFAGEKDFAWGNFGVDLGLSGMYFSNPYLGLGADIHFSGFVGSDTEFFTTSGYHWHNYKMELNTSLFQFMGAGRLYLNPEGRARLYIPFGAGLTVANGEFVYEEDHFHPIKWDHTSASLGYYVGLGWEVDWQENSAFGLEARYNSFRYDMSNLASKVGIDSPVGEKDYSYFSLVFTLSFR